eukprot:CAMPEP_0169157926 /NCGR_PEP_ID=MMETSP1015-20121227/54882_1 /TAXON_ID=342587 /ORGANISM="Karlodinium micrum, Strain CCMP2283" /LENGTH=59 /DNA_ID=CAMNT_0009228969 /DNA_START=1 /DNA_END=177 /DNA_ORIENTATION=+
MIARVSIRIHEARANYASHEESSLIAEVSYLAQIYVVIVAAIVRHPMKTTSCHYKANCD